MVTLRNHGGSCCGAMHIHNFAGDNRPQDFDELYQYTQQRDPCLHEVILNQTQCQNNPRLLARLAEMGYVLTTGFVNGNHDSSVFVFHRAGQRLALNDLSFDWAGQIASPSLRGRLTRLPFRQPGTGNVPTKVRGSYVDPRDIRVGDRFTYINPSNQLNGATLTRTIEKAVNPYADRVTLVHQATGLIYERAVGTLRWYSQAAVQAAQTVPIPGQLHTQDDVEVVRTPVAAPPPAPEPRRVVHTTFHNVYRDGRVGAGYLSIEEANRAAPRALSVLRKRIFSDGVILENTVGVD